MYVYLPLTAWQSCIEYPFLINHSMKSSQLSLDTSISLSLSVVPAVDFTPFKLSLLLCGFKAIWSVDSDSSPELSMRRCILALLLWEKNMMLKVATYTFTALYCQYRKWAYKMGFGVHPKTPSKKKHHCKHIGSYLIGLKRWLHRNTQRFSSFKVPLFPMIPLQYWITLCMRLGLSNHCVCHLHSKCQFTESGAHWILWTREQVTAYTTNITGKIQTWRPNTNNSIIQIRKTKHVAKCYIIITCKEQKVVNSVGIWKLSLSVKHVMDFVV